MKQTEMFGVWVVPMHQGLTCPLQCVHQSGHYLKSERIAALLKDRFPVYHVEIRVRD